MKRFAALYQELDRTTRSSVKVDAIRRYFERTPPADAAWGLWFLCGNRLRTAVKTARLKAWAAQRAGIPEWLFDACHDTVGDLAETVALALPPAAGASELPLHLWVERRLLPLGGMDEAAQRSVLLAAWDGLPELERFVLNKLITGALRVGVSRQLALRGLALATGSDPERLALGVAGGWQPSAAAFAALLAGEGGGVAQPYPFFLAHPLPGAPEELGDRADWLAEWKWDGIRAQLIHRDGQVNLWSRGEEPVAQQFPEVAAAGAALPPGTVLDGELLAWRDGACLPFARLQRRLGRKAPGARIRAEVPAALLAFDLLEWCGEDVRRQPLAWRRERLEALFARLPSGLALVLSPLVAGDWAALAAAHAASRDRGAEGLMLKRLASAYGVGRPRGEWWKWKVAPLSADAVLMYAQSGHGRRAGLLTDYTLGVWNAGELVPFAKAYSGLTDAEIAEVDRLVRRHATERFGPVRAVPPLLVFEVGFEGIQPSRRHKSGLAVRFPRLLRWRRDKRPEDADTLDSLRALLGVEAGADA